jgi:hypothetical protein
VAQCAKSSAAATELQRNRMLLGIKAQMSARIAMNPHQSSLISV